MELRTLATPWILALIGPVLTGSPVGAQETVPLEQELATSVGEGFTIAAVGDVIIAHSLEHRLSDPGFEEVVELLRQADVAR